MHDPVEIYLPGDREHPVEVPAGQVPILEARGWKRVTGQKAAKTTAKSEED